MFDFLGTFTRTQLLERNAFLQAQVHALPKVISTLETHKNSLGSLITKDDAQTFTVQSQTDGQVYTLGNVTIPTLNSGPSLEKLTQSAVKSRYPLRIDPLTNIISLGDAAWRPSAKVMSTEDLQSNRLDNVPDDDSIASFRSWKIWNEFRGVSKRQEAVESKVLKLRYRYLRLDDEIKSKKKLLSKFQDEIDAILRLLNDKVEITSTDGKTVTSTSDYKTAGVDQKTDVTDQNDVERLYDLFLPPVSIDDESVDQTSSQVLPLDPKDQVSSNLPGGWKPGSIEETMARFPLLKNIKDRRNLQVIANVYEYGFKKNILVPFSDSSSLMRSQIGKGAETDHRYLPPNVAEDLVAYAGDIYKTYGVKFIVTEAWPPTVQHGSGGHDTGNCVDMVLSIVTKKKTIDGVGLPELAQRIIDYGVKKGYIRSGYNEYVKDSTHKTGPHIHLNFTPKYFNEGELFRS